MTLKHAKFSASGSDRWLNCPGSISLAEKAPPPPSSPYAEEGTRAHGVLETILKEYINGGKPFTKAYDLEKEFGKEIVNHALGAFKWIEAKHLAAGDGAEVLSEVKINLPVKYPGQFGTVDAAIFEPFGTLTVFDFKYGAGYRVDAKDNSQLIYYALGLAEVFGWNFGRVHLVIYQPRLADANPDAAFPGSEAFITAEDLKSWRDKFESGIAAALRKDAARTPGEWCRWCPAKAICPEISEKALSQALVDFDPVSTKFKAPDPALIPHLGQTLILFDRLESWIESVREYAHRQLEAGAEVRGWKLVQKRSTRKWTDVEKTSKEARKAFGDTAFTEPELKSPAQLEKTGVVHAAWIEKRVSSISSGTTMAREDDSRPAVQPLTQEFGSLPTARGSLEPPKTSATKKTKGK